MLVEQFNIKNKNFDLLLGDIKKLTMTLEHTEGGAEVLLSDDRIAWQKRDCDNHVEIVIEYLIIESELANAQFNVKSIKLESDNGQYWTKHYHIGDFPLSFNNGLLELERKFNRPVEVK